MHRIFFSFDYADFDNACIIRNACRFKQAASALFIGKSIWSQATLGGEAAIKKLIDFGVTRSDVTVFLVGENTHRRKWCRYALDLCATHQKGILGIYLPNQVFRGPAEWLTSRGIDPYDWNSKHLSYWIEAVLEEPLSQSLA